MNCLVIDDNKMARTAMKELTSRIPELIVAGECFGISWLVKGEAILKDK